MARVRVIVSKALEARDKAGIKVRQPLAKLTIKTPVDKDLLEVIREEVNVKGVEVGKIETDVQLDTELTSELKEEGFVRDVIRTIQGARKAAGLKPGDLVDGEVSVPSEELATIGRRLEKEIKIATSMTNIIWCVEKDISKTATDIIVSIHVPKVSN
jgi:isoleucyl-tRNA synthetase